MITLWSSTYIHIANHSYGVLSSSLFNEPQESRRRVGMILMTTHTYLHLVDSRFDTSTEYYMNRFSSFILYFVQTTRDFRFQIMELLKFNSVL